MRTIRRHVPGQEASRSGLGDMFAIFGMIECPAVLRRFVLELRPRYICPAIRANADSVNEEQTAAYATVNAYYVVASTFTRNTAAYATANA